MEKILVALNSDDVSDWHSIDQLEIVALTEQELCELHDQELYEDASWYGDVNTIPF